MKAEEREAVLEVCRRGGLAAIDCEQSGSVLKVDVQADEELVSAKEMRAIGQELQSGSRPYVGLDLKGFAEEGQ